MGIFQNSSRYSKTTADRDVIAAERLHHAARKTGRGLIIFRANKQDFGVFVEAEQDDGREGQRGLGGIPLPRLRYS